MAGFTIRVIGAATCDIHASHPHDIETAVDEVTDAIATAGVKRIGRPFAKMRTLQELADQCMWMNWHLQVTYEPGI